jgi:hypothetical protein
MEGVSFVTSVTDLSRPNTGKEDDDDADDDEQRIASRFTQVTRCQSCEKRKILRFSSDEKGNTYKIEARK